MTHIQGTWLLEAKYTGSILLYQLLSDFVLIMFFMIFGNFFYFYFFTLQYPRKIKFYLLKDVFDFILYTCMIGKEIPLDFIWKAAKYSIGHTYLPFAMIMIWKYWILSNMEHLNLSLYSDIIYLFTIPLQSQTCSCTWTCVMYLPTIQNNFFKRVLQKGTNLV